MEQKQTGVEWLISQLQKSKDWHRVLSEVSQMSSAKVDILEQAKQMEKEQIIDAWNNLYAESSEQYYNEEYGK